MPPLNERYADKAPSRTEVEAAEGPLLLEFGAPWCGYCLAVQPLLAEALADRGGIVHVKIEDGPGRRLGRSFKVKLWPTLIFLKDGREAARLVRPASVAVIREALDTIA